MEELLKVIENLKKSDLVERIIPYAGGNVTLLFVRQLVDRAALSEQVIKPIMQHCSAPVSLNAQKTLDTVIYADDCKIETEPSRIEEHVLGGMVVMLFSNDSNFLVANLKKVEHRAVTEPELMYTMHSPRDCFVENLETNLSLLRYRIKDKSLRVENFKVGARSKSNIVMSYIEDIANAECVAEIKKRIEQISIDGIVDSGELHNFLLNKKNTLFPQMGIIERSDMASESLLKGKIIILVDGSNLALVAPKVMPEFLYSCDDRYDNVSFGLFSRILRYLSLIISFSASSLYVAVESFHNDILPASYILLIAQMRTKVPFTALVGTLILEFLIELIRESLIRIPKQIGLAVGIVSVIIIGQASVAAGLFTNVLLILVCVELLASFVIPDYTLMNPFRIMKFALLIMTGCFGFYGFSLGLLLILVKVVSIDSFGIPYAAPYAPFNGYDFLRSQIFSKTFSAKRQQYLRTKDDKRSSKD